MTVPYSQTIQAIMSVCLKINITFSKEGDGRLISAIKEREYLDSLKSRMLENYPTFTVEISKERYWYDVIINSIPINLKLTTGGTDNAFNKVAIIYTITGSISKRNMNYDEWFRIITNSTKKMTRDKQTEYHYLVIHKNTGQILLKSILDIHTYNTNPCNILQINWNNEFKYIDSRIRDDRFKRKILELLTTVQTSLIQYQNSSKEFCSADLSTIFLGS